MGELTNGVPTETAKNIKIAENEKLYKELMQQAKNNEEKLRKENQLESILESVEGIGNKRKIELLKNLIVSEMENINLENFLNLVSAEDFPKTLMIGWSVN